MFEWPYYTLPPPNRSTDISCLCCRNNNWQHTLHIFRQWCWILAYKCIGCLLIKLNFSRILCHISERLSCKWCFKGIVRIESWFLRIQSCRYTGFRSMFSLICKLIELSIWVFESWRLSRCRKQHIQSHWLQCLVGFDMKVYRYILSKFKYTWAC